jgi:hypothetical protein
MGKPDMAKERHWREVLRRFAASDLGTRRFCAQERVSEHQFHWWRRRLRQSVQRPLHPVASPSRGATSPSRDFAPRRRLGAAKRRSRLVAVNSLSNASNDAPASPFWSVSAPLTLSAPLEIVHPRGHVIRVPAQFDAAALARILAMLDRAGAVAEEGAR